VKTRIEQMTQRTWNVKPFDMLSITRITPPLRGFDIRVDTYVDFQLNFDGLFTVLDELAGKINKQTNSLMQGITKQVNNVSSKSADLTNGMQDAVDKGNVNIQGLLEGATGSDLALLGNQDIDENTATNEEDRTTTPDVLRKSLIEQIAVFKSSEAGAVYQ